MIPAEHNAILRYGQKDTARHASHHQPRLTLLSLRVFVAVKSQERRVSKPFDRSALMLKTEVQNFRNGKNQVSEPLAARSSNKAETLLRERPG